MTLAQMLVPEFDQEMRTTRSLLERFPEAERGWRPHPKSMTLGQLAAHVATIPVWGTTTLVQTEFDMSPPGGPSFKTPEIESTAGLLALFDENVAGARAALAKASDADLGVVWTLKNAGATIFAMPRAAVFRAFVMSHLIHHRGQLSVYLRLRDVPLPSIYGPTADTPMR
jgi:uncharacterized damage-inducible protein DinB